MKLLKQAMAVVGTVVLIAMIVVLVTPKVAHAVATAVNVINTAANPAGTEDISKTASQVVELQCSVWCDQVDSGGGDQGIYAVPYPQNFIITSVEIYNPAPGPGFCNVSLYEGVDQYVLREQWIAPNSSSTVLQFPTSGIVIDAGENLREVTTNGCTTKIHGYLTTH